MLGLVVCASLLGACGQRGPLYLPEQGPPKKRLSAQAVPDSAVPASGAPHSSGPSDGQTPSKHS